MKRAVILCAFFLVALGAAIGPPSHETEAQANCFPETGFCVTNPAFMEYFRVRGGVRIMGYPISRSFTLEGFEVQFFQRVIFQLQGGQVSRLNVLDPNVMPMTRANQSIFPAPDPSLAAQAPQVGAPDYPRQVVEFVRGSRRTSGTASRSGSSTCSTRPSRSPSRSPARRRTRTW